MSPREQLFALLRNLKWMMAIGILICAILYLPDQVRELYRLAAADIGLATMQFVSVCVIAIAMWFGAFQLTNETAAATAPQSNVARYCHIVLPILLGLLPILAVIAAHAEYLLFPPHFELSSEELAQLREVGRIFRIQENMLIEDKGTLFLYLVILIGIAGIFVPLLSRTGEAIQARSYIANEAYFSRPVTLLITIFLITSLTAIFVAVPDSLAQTIGAFGVLALFTICVVAFSIHISVLTVRHKFPYFPVIFIVAFVLAASPNDNYSIRLLKTPTSESTRLSASVAFASWLTQDQRYEDILNADVYPVFVVSAQGGGLYAAYNAATFLARIQDLCPAFRQHLFAISSVSGGSVGAAVFASSLASNDHLRGAFSYMSNRQGGSPCPRIYNFLSSVSSGGLDTPGENERYVQSVLKTDFLSPLIGGSLFPNFTQFFLPVSIGAFDRTRALEYALENAIDSRNNGQQNNGFNLMKQDFQSLWAPDNGLPALLMNSTDTGSGKRILISPFDIDAADPKDADLCVLANVKRKPTFSSESLHFPLSTAALMSARFPWVTPAATVKVTNDCITQRNDVTRIVDGGYIDNSGIQSALDLINQLDATVKRIPTDLSHFNNDETVRYAKLTLIAPKIVLFHIALASGDFPDHGTFSFDDLMEPIRALLSGRSSRAYVALNSAKARATSTSENNGQATQTQSGAESISTFNRINLENFFYNLPLGWALSGKTQDIISLDSGRFWDCRPDGRLSQSVPHLSNADCILIQIYHLLNGSTNQALKEIAGREAKDGNLQAFLQEEGSSLYPRIDHEQLLDCYERKWFQSGEYDRYLDRMANTKGAGSEAEKNAHADRQHGMAGYQQHHLAYFQAEQVRALTAEWDKRPELRSRFLGYLLGSISYDSWDFTRTSEGLSFSAESEIPYAWKTKIYNKGLNPTDLLNNPEKFANVVWENYEDGNKNPGDGWKYRERGIYQIIGSNQYRETNKLINRLYPNMLNILDDPDEVSNTKVSAVVAFAHFLFYPYRISSTPREYKTIAQQLEDPSYNWQSIRARQTDVEHQKDDQEEVAKRSDMFLGCIDEATKSKSDTGGEFDLGRLGGLN